MPELGQIRKPTPNTVAIYLWAGHPPVLGWYYFGPSAFGKEAREKLAQLPDGSVIDVGCLPEIVVLSEPAPAVAPTRINDDTLDALLREAEVMGKGE